MRQKLTRAATLVCLSVLATLSIPVISNSGELNAKGDLPKDVEEILSKAFPSMRIVGRGDEDAGPCSSFSDHPGWVAGDYRGTGRIDYAVLLVDPGRKERGTFNGQPYTVNSFAFAVLLAQPSGKFETTVLDRFEENLPTGKGLMPRASGSVYSLKDYKTVHLQNAAIIFFSCDQYSVIYYWDGKQFSNFGIAN
jgi:hypothetical protein